MQPFPLWKSSLCTFIAYLCISVLSACSESVKYTNFYKASDVTGNAQPDVQVGEVGGDLSLHSGQEPNAENDPVPSQLPLQSPETLPSPTPSQSVAPNHPSGSPGQTPMPPKPSQTPNVDRKDDEPGTGTEGERPQMPIPSRSPIPSPRAENHDSDSDSCDLNAPSILLLSESGKGLRVGGTSSAFDIAGTVQVNSRDKFAVMIEGKGVSVSAKKMSVVGGLKIGPNAKLSGDVIKGASSMEDPLKEIAPPECEKMPLRSNKRLRIESTLTLEPGRYAGGIFVMPGANVTLKSGIYCLMGGGLRVHSGKIEGSGVMIYNFSEAREETTNAIDIKKGANVKLSSISDCTSPYHGISIFQDRNKGRQIRLASEGVSIKGMIYAPSSQVLVRDKAGTRIHPFEQLIARKLRVNMGLNSEESDKEGRHPKDEMDD